MIYIVLYSVAPFQHRFIGSKQLDLLWSKSNMMAK